MDLREMPSGTDCRLRAGAYRLSAGTRLVTLSPVFEHGYVHVQTRTPPSHKLIEQGFPKDGKFDVEFDLLQPVRNRSKEEINETA